MCLYESLLLYTLAHWPEHGSICRILQGKAATFDDLLRSKSEQENYIKRNN